MPLLSCRSSSNFDSLPRSSRGREAAIHKLKQSAARGALPGEDADEAVRGMDGFARHPSEPTAVDAMASGKMFPSMGKSKTSLHGYDASRGSDGTTMTGATIAVGGGGLARNDSTGTMGMKRSGSMLSRRGSTQSRRALKVSSAALTKRAPPVSSDNFAFVSSDQDPRQANGVPASIQVKRGASMDIGANEGDWARRFDHYTVAPSRASHDGTMSRRGDGWERSMSYTGEFGAAPFPTESAPSSPSKKPSSTRKKAISGPIRSAAMGLARPASAQGYIGGDRRDMAAGGNSHQSSPAKKRVVQKDMIGLPTNFQVSTAEELCSVSFTDTHEFAAHWAHRGLELFYGELDGGLGCTQDAASGGCCCSSL